MDISDRLNVFIAYLGLSNSQFADKTGIPRPTLSQILNKRNKTVNDQLLKKLNESYPSLNLLWLMFGQGEMLINANNEMSEPENEINDKSFSLNSSDNRETTTAQSHYFTEPNIFSNSFSEQKTVETACLSKGNPVNSHFDSNLENEKITMEQNSIKMPKNIKSIIVFYDDGTFETFRPVSK